MVLQSMLAVVMKCFGNPSRPYASGFFAHLDVKMYLSFRTQTLGHFLSANFLQNWFIECFLLGRNVSISFCRSSCCYHLAFCFRFVVIIFFFIILDVDSAVVIYFVVFVLVLVLDVTAVSFLVVVVFVFGPVLCFVVVDVFFVVVSVIVTAKALVIVFVVFAFVVVGVVALFLQLQWTFLFSLYKESYIGLYRYVWEYIKLSKCVTCCEMQLSNDRDKD